MLIYRNLGDKAQQEFAKTWGIGYGLDNATEWQEARHDACHVSLLALTRVDAGVQDGCENRADSRHSRPAAPKQEQLLV
jgi:hypothetical protein